MAGLKKRTLSLHLPEEAFNAIKTLAKEQQVSREALLLFALKNTPMANAKTWRELLQFEMSLKLGEAFPKTNTNPTTPPVKTSTEKIGKSHKSG